MTKGLAYFNHGRWVVDCPADGCDDARLVYEVDPRTGIPTGRRLTEETCANGHHFSIDMPPEQLEAQIVTAVAERPHDADKSWYPAGHVRGALAGFPVGQTPAELRAENGEVARYRARQEQDKRDRLRRMLDELNITVNPDGTFEGAL